MASLPMPRTAPSATMRHALARPVSCTGIGLHGGREVQVTLRPGRAGSGIVFRRVDVAGSIAAGVGAVVAVDHATTLQGSGDGAPVRISTVEHLLAGLHGMGVDDCVVEIDGDEVPILDGSAAPWVRLIAEAGLQSLGRRRHVRRVTRRLRVESGRSWVEVEPADTLRLTCSIDFDHPAIGRQECSFHLDARTFETEIAPARTFGFLRDVVALRRAGLVKGGSYDNAIVLDERGVLNGSLRFPDEFVRHKALDLIGDLALTGLPLLGHVRAHAAGHAAHVRFATTLLATPAAWRIEPAGTADPEEDAGTVALPVAGSGLPLALPSAAWS